MRLELDFVIDSKIVKLVQRKTKSKNGNEKCG